MGRTKSSARWLKEHFSDHYVKQAQKEGYRSRAAYKLLEIQEKDKIIKPGMTVVDLGSAPGGWSQGARKLVGAKGLVIAVDILPMAQIDGIFFIHGDFQKKTTVLAVLDRLQGAVVDVVLSDMAPNMSGNDIVDCARICTLAESAFYFAKQVLTAGGAFIVKLFRGEGFDEYVRELRCFFREVHVRKPEASRDRSKECYVVAKGFIFSV